MTFDSSLIQLMIAIIVFLLSIVVLLKSQGGRSQPGNPIEDFEASMNKALAPLDFDRFSRPTSPPAPKNSPYNQAAQPRTSPPQPAPSELVEKLRRFYRALNQWYEVAASLPNMGEIAHKKANDYRDRFEQLIQKAVRENSRPSADSKADMIELSHSAAKEMVAASDKDLDRQRTKPQLQQALLDLVAAANLELICPEKDTIYPPHDRHLEQRGIPANRVRKKVGAVLVRGLRTSSGSVLLDPEIEETD